MQEKEECKSRDRSFGGISDIKDPVVPQKQPSESDTIQEFFQREESSPNFDEIMNSKKETPIKESKETADDLPKGEVDLEAILNNPAEKEDDPYANPTEIDVNNNKDLFNFFGKAKAASKVQNKP